NSPLGSCFWTGLLVDRLVRPACSCPACFGLSPHRPEGGALADPFACGAMALDARRDGPGGDVPGGDADLSLVGVPSRWRTVQPPRPSVRRPVSVCFRFCCRWLLRASHPPPLAGKRVRVLTASRDWRLVAQPGVGHPGPRLAPAGSRDGEAGLFFLELEEREQ